MAKYEIEKRVRTPDGVDHPSVEAADWHMKKLGIEMLGGASSHVIREVLGFTAEKTVSAEYVAALRTAIRDVYLMAWPRAPRGSKTATVAPAQAPTEAPTTEAASEAPSALVAEIGTADPSPAIVHDMPDPDMEPPAPTHEFPVEPVHETHEVSHDFSEAPVEHQAPAHSSRSRKRA